MPCGHHRFPNPQSQHADKTGSQAALHGCCRLQYAAVLTYLLLLICLFNFLTCHAESELGLYIAANQCAKGISCSSSGPPQGLHDENATTG